MKNNASTVNANDVALEFAIQKTLSLSISADEGLFLLLSTVLLPDHILISQTTERAEGPKMKYWEEFAFIALTLEIIL